MRGLQATEGRCIIVLILGAEEPLPRIACKRVQRTSENGVSLRACVTLAQAVTPSNKVGLPKQLIASQSYSQAFSLSRSLLYSCGYYTYTTYQLNNQRATIMLLYCIQGFASYLKYLWDFVRQGQIRTTRGLSPSRTILSAASQTRLQITPERAHGATK